MWFLFLVCLRCQRLHKSYGCWFVMWILRNSWGIFELLRMTSGYWLFVGGTPEMREVVMAYRVVELRSKIVFFNFPEHSFRWNILRIFHWTFLILRDIYFLLLYLYFMRYIIIIYKYSNIYFEIYIFLLYFCIYIQFGH